jgi:hypothetical protein
MNDINDPRKAARFLRTLRVATQTALALDDITRGRGQMRSGATFSALAAKGVGDWRFPAAGLMSADGLVLARLLHETDATKVLALQAQGAAGLSTYADRAVRLRLGEGREIEGVFDRDGQMHVVLDGHLYDEADFSTFEIEMGDDAP